MMGGGRTWGIVSTQRPHSALFASSSSMAHSSQEFRCKSSGSFFPLCDTLEILVGSLAQAPTLSTPYPNTLKYVHGGVRHVSLNSRLRKSRALAVSAGIHKFDEFLPRAINTPPIQISNFEDQCRRLVKRDETSNEGAWFPKAVLSNTGRVYVYASISARTYKPPPVQVSNRSAIPRYITGGVFLSITVWIFWLINKTESYARQQLGSVEEPFVTPTPTPGKVNDYEIAKASVAQGGLVNSAVAAVRANNLLVCSIEIELALQENMVARTSIETDFYEKEELVQVYKAVIKMWLDGYPLDYGKVLQLRGLLDMPNEKAEALEKEVSEQSDVYFI